MTSYRTLLFLGATLTIACEASERGQQADPDTPAPSETELVDAEAERAPEDEAQSGFDGEYPLPSDAPVPDEDDGYTGDGDRDAEEEGDVAGDGEPGSEEDAGFDHGTETSGFDSPIDDGRPGGGDEDGEDEDGEDEPADCEQNEVRVQTADGAPLATFSRFVFQDDGETIWLVGYETGDTSDACDWASSPSDAGGYALSIEVTGDRSAGAEKTWMDDDDVEDAAEIRIENGGSGYSIEAENDSGSLTVDSYAAGEALELSGFTGQLSDGSFVDDGAISACYCGSMVVE